MPAAQATSKGKATERPPSRDAPTPQQTLQQLKSDIENSPGVVKNASDARNFLINRQWALNEQQITCSHLATVLLSLVSIQGQRKSTDKLPESIANTVKAVAFLLEESVIAQYADQISARLPSDLTNADNNAKLKENLDTLNENMQKHMEKIQKAVEEIKATPIPSHTVTNLASTNSDFPYRDALINNLQPTLLPPTNVHEAKLMNRVNIDARQILIEIQSSDVNPISDDPTDNRSPSKLKIAANHWLSNRDGENPPPPDTIIRAITVCRNNKLLIETNTAEAAKWIKLNATRILSPIIGHPVKILDRVYTVIARFMPVIFQANEEGTRELESSANLPEKSITQVIWVKNPERRNNGQQFANLKILCNSAEAANSLIMSAGRITHLGSQIQFHKDIKVPGTCSKCQHYGHTMPNCKSAVQVCAKCAENHPSHECQARSLKCTPCKSTNHQSNDERCPERIARVKAIHDRKPEQLAQFYATAERWTWGQPLSTPTETNDITRHHNRRINRNGTRHGKPTAGPSGWQRTLDQVGISSQPKQTGANSIPIKAKKPANIRPSSPAPAQVRPLTPQSTNTIETPAFPNHSTTPQ